MRSSYFQIFFVEILVDPLAMEWAHMFISH